MSCTKIIINFFYIAYILLAIHSCTTWLVFNPVSNSLTISFIQKIIVFISFLFLLFTKKNLKKGYYSEGLRLFNIFLIYTVFLSLYSLIVNTSGITKYDFIDIFMYIISMFSISLVYVMINPFWFYKILRFVIKITPIMVLFLFTLMKNELIGDIYGFLLRPIYFAIIFIGVLNNKYKILYIGFAISTIILGYNYDARSNAILTIFCLITSLIIFLYNRLSFLRHLAWLMIILPFFFLGLGVSGTFNIFETDKYLETDLKEESMIDTRTQLYYEVITSAINNNYILFGRGIGRGYESEYQELSNLYNKTATDISSKERHSEAGIHNIFTWGGIVYVLIYTIMWSSIIYNGLYKSKNKYVSGMAIFLSFYYFYSWVENFQSFSIMFISSWFLVAFCLSPYFRKMNDKEICVYIKRIIQ